MDAEAKKMIGHLWADTGERMDPEEAGIDRAKGWDRDYEQEGTGKYPRRAVSNQLRREIQGALVEKMLYGAPRYAADVNWPLNAYVNYNGLLYRAVVANGPADELAGPESPAGSETRPGAVWRRF